ncbi:hypothetical protein BaRGS_00013743, partial [Batillaria attramentaria]
IRARLRRPDVRSAGGESNGPTPSLDLPAPNPAQRYGVMTTRGPPLTVDGVSVIRQS